MKRSASHWGRSASLNYPSLRKASRAEATAKAIDARKASRSEATVEATALRPRIIDGAKLPAISWRFSFETLGVALGRSRCLDHRSMRKASRAEATTRPIDAHKASRSEATVEATALRPWIIDQE